MKYIAYFLIDTVTLFAGITWYNTFISGQYWVHNNPGVTLLMGSIPIGMIVGIYYATKAINSKKLLYDMNALEETYTILINKKLAKRGVEIEGSEMVPIYGEQTEQAIDLANAERILEAKGLLDVSHQMAIAKAGATKIIINTPSEKATVEEDK